jgi:AraC family transcriptional regulator
MIAVNVVEPRLVTPDLVIETLSRTHPARVEEVFTEPLHTLVLHHARLAEPTMARFRSANASGAFCEIGRVLTMPADVPMEVKGLGGQIGAVRCRFTPSLLKRISGRPHFDKRDELAACINIRGASVRQRLQALTQELEQPGFASEALIEALGIGIVVELARYLWDTPPSSRRPGRLSIRQMETIIDYINSCERAPSLSEVSREVGFSPRHLSRVFRAETGKTLYDYIENVRFKRACDLLVNSDLLIKEIAFRLGFTCSSNFAVAFRKRIGISPQDYARMRRN